VSGAHGPRGGPGPGPGGRVVDPTRKVKDFRATLNRLLGTLHPHRFRLVAVVLATGLSVFLNVLGPKVLGDATNVIFAGVVGRMVPAGVTKEEAVAALRASGESQLADLMSAVDFVPGQGIDLALLGQIVLTVLALYVGAALAALVAARILTRVVQETGFTLRRTVQEKLDRLPLAYLSGHARGDVLSRVTNDIDNITQTLQQTLSQVVTAVLTVVGVLGMMVWLSWQLSLIALVVVPLSAYVTVTIAKRAQPNFVRQWKATGDVGGVVEEAFTGHEVIAAFGGESRFASDFATSNDELYDASWQAQFISNTMMPTMMFLSNVSYVAVAVAGGLKVLNGTITLGEVQAFIQYSRQFNQPLAQLASMANLLQSGLASAERVFELLDEREERPDVVTGALPAQVGEVVFDHVTFSYLPGTPVITNLSLRAAPGQTVAIVGPTGAGKTTLVNLLMRFYEVDSGRILIDGVDTATVSRDDVRSRIGMVLQDTWLLEASIADNIAYARPQATEEEVLAAAVATNVDRLVRTLPDGYDTIVTDESISSGEKQLITIARAFLADPQILVLDEATSSVDTRTEVLVQHAMHALRQGRTSFIIAHRLSTIRDADLIVVMEHGDVVEQGTHESLLAAGGAYAVLYQAQFEGAMTEE
jgi:ATP-binding cassette subfamily B protein